MLQHTKSIEYALTATPAELDQACRIIMHLVRLCMLGNHQVFLHAAFTYQGSAVTATRVHTHDMFEAQLMLAGTADCYSGSGWQGVAPGQVTLHAAKAPHAWRAKGEPFRRFTLAFNVTPAITMRLPDCWPAQPALVANLGMLLTEIHTPTPGWTDRIELLVALMISQLLTLTDWPTVTLPELTVTTPQVLALDRFIEDNLHRPLSREDIANYLGISERTLTRMMRAVTGETLLERLERLRIARACKLLTETAATIRTVSDLVGFSNASYFCRRFHRAVGATPAEYRAKNDITPTGPAD